MDKSCGLDVHKYSVFVCILDEKRRNTLFLSKEIDISTYYL